MKGVTKPLETIGEKEDRYKVIFEYSKKPIQIYTILLVPKNSQDF